MKRGNKVILAVLVAGALSVGITGAALAFGPRGNTDVVPPVNGNCTYDIGPVGAGMRGLGMGLPTYLASLSELLGLTPEEVMEQRLEDTSLLDIAQAQGISEQQLIDTIIAARSEVLQEKVDAGIITQEQADAIIEHMNKYVPDMLERTSVGSGEGRGYGLGAGGTWAARSGMGRGGWGVDGR